MPELLTPDSYVVDWMVPPDSLARRVLQHHYNALQGGGPSLRVPITSTVVYRAGPGPFDIEIARGPLLDLPLIYHEVDLDASAHPEEHLRSLSGQELRMFLPVVDAAMSESEQKFVCPEYFKLPQYLTFVIQECFFKQGMRVKDYVQLDTGSLIAFADREDVGGIGMEWVGAGWKCVRKSGGTCTYAGRFGIYCYPRGAIGVVPPASTMVAVKGIESK